MKYAIIISTIQVKSMENFFDQVVEQYFNESNKKIKENYINILIMKGLTPIYFNKYKNDQTKNKFLFELTNKLIASSDRNIIEPNEEEAFSWLIKHYVEEKPNKFFYFLHNINTPEKIKTFSNLYKNIDFSVNAKSIEGLLNSAQTVDDFHRCYQYLSFLNDNEQDDIIKQKLYKNIKETHLDSTNYILRIYEKLQAPLTDVISQFFQTNNMKATDNFNNINYFYLDKIINELDKNRKNDFFKNIFITTRSHFSKVPVNDLFFNTLFDFCLKNKNNTKILNTIAYELSQFIKNTPQLAKLKNKEFNPQYSISWIIYILENNKPQNFYNKNKLDTLVTNLEKMALGKQIIKVSEKIKPTKIVKL